MRAALLKVVEALIARTPAGASLTIDQVGDAIGTRAASPPEIDEMIDLLEKSGRHVQSPEGQRGETHLKKVIAAARELRAAGVAPRAEEIATRTGLTRDEVEHALALVRVMQR